MLHPLEFADPARRSPKPRAPGPNDHALVCLLGMLDCVCRKSARPTSPTFGTRPATNCCNCSARAPSRPASPVDRPHGQRRTYCTTGLVAGISIRDMQYAVRHADPRTTRRYDMAKANLGRHAAHAVAAYVAA